MTTRLSKLALAAVLGASLPALAAANDPGRPCDRDRDGRPDVVTPAYAPAPPPAYAPPPAPYRDDWRERRWGEREGRERGWREGAWRHQELDRIHAQLARLDAERADFHADNAYRPGQLRRYDRWYFARRAELERREWQLERVAWR